jgi:tetratricopeptide (TPR) repeat protein
LVGRDVEWHELSLALDDMRKGHGALFLIDGDTGIGKTRLAEAFAEEAAEEGCTDLCGRAWDAAGAPAYWPWTQVLRDLVKSRPAEEILEDLGADGPYLAQIAPDVGRRLLRTVDALPPLETEDARFAAFDATASFLRASAARQPIVMVLDDLNAADVATVRLLEFLTRNMYGVRILAIATCRTGGLDRDSELATAIADLSGPPARRLVLGSLSRTGVAELAGARGGYEPPPALVDRLYKLTEGNPLFVEEVMRLLAAEGVLAAPGSRVAGRLPLPDAVTEIVRRRLAPIPPAVLHALTAAAVIGPEFDLETLARVLGEERGTLLGDLDSAAEAGLVVEAEGRLGHYRFSHALIRETLYDGLSSQERVRLHELVGNALLELRGTGPDAPLNELAHHFLHAAPATDPVRAAVFAERAAERALEAMAYESAIELFDSALGVLDLASGEAERRARIRLTMGQAEMRCGRLEAGRATLRKAADDARLLGDAELLARAALASAPWGLATAMSDEADLIPLLKRARASLPPEDGTLRARLTARLASASYWSASLEDRMALGEQAIAMARRVGDPASLAWVLSDVHLATWNPDSLERTLEWVAEIDSLAERAGNLELAMLARSWRISLVMERGSPGARRVVDREIDAFARTAVQLHQQRAQAHSLIHHCAMALIEGRFEDAQRRLDDVANEFDALLQQDLITQMRASALTFVMRECQGKLSELEGAVQYFAGAHTAMPVWRCALVAVYVQTGRERELRREYGRLASGGFTAIPRDNLWLPALGLLTTACFELGDRRGASQLRAFMEPYAGRNVVAPDVVYLGPVDRYLALAAATEGDYAQAGAWFDSARELAGALGARPMAVRLAIEEALALREREPTRAAALAAEALPEAEALGLEHLVKRARGLSPRAVFVPASPTEPLPRQMTLSGDTWEVVFGGHVFHVERLKGMSHLTCLLAEPGRSFHALELVGAGRAAATAPLDPGLPRAVEGDLGPLLDERAKADYRARIDELDEEIEEAEVFNDPERASRARWEKDQLASELERAVGLGGRDRRVGAPAERARVNVTRALREAIKRIDHHDAALGHHLESCVKTGMFCVYRPPPNAARWDIDPGS